MKILLYIHVVKITYVSFAFIHLLCVLFSSHFHPLNLIYSVSVYTVWWWYMKRIFNFLHFYFPFTSVFVANIRCISLSQDEISNVKMMAAYIFELLFIFQCTLELQMELRAITRTSIGLNACQRDMTIGWAWAPDYTSCLHRARADESPFLSVRVINYSKVGCSVWHEYFAFMSYIKS